MGASALGRAAELAELSGDMIIKWLCSWLGVLGPNECERLYGENPDPPTGSIPEPPPAPPDPPPRCAVEAMLTRPLPPPPPPIVHRVELIVRDA
jgi:hypothetical protein